jgi:MFS family permease
MTGLGLNVKLFLLRTFLAGVYSGITGIIFNLYILEIGFNPGSLGLILSITLLASSIFPIPAGILCDMLGKRKTLLISSVLYTASLFPIFLSNSLSVLLLFSFLGGVFGSISAVCLTPFLMESKNKNDTSIRVFSINSSISWTASVIGCAIGGTLPLIFMKFNLSHGIGNYRLTLVASSLLMVAACIIVLFMKNDDVPKNTYKQKKKLKISGNAMKFTAISVIMGLGSGMIIPYFNIYFTKVLNVNIMNTGLIFAIADIFIVIGFISMPFISSKIGKLKATVVTELASIPFLIILALTTDLMVASSAYVLRMLLMNVSGPASTSIQMELLEPEERGFAVGLISTGSSLAIAISTYIGGYLISSGDYGMAYGITSIAYASGAALMYLFFKSSDDAGKQYEKPLKAGIPSGV